MLSFLNIFGTDALTTKKLMTTELSSPPLRLQTAQLEMVAGWINLRFVTFQTKMIRQ